jgi:hypothetical protein
MKTLEGEGAMPFDPSAVSPRLISAAQYGNLVPFVGAGVSRQAGSQFPGWITMLKQMKDRAVERGDISQADGQEVIQLIDRQELLMSAEALRKHLP